MRSPQILHHAAKLPRLWWISGCSEKAALSRECDQSRRRGERFVGLRKFTRLGEFDGRWNGRCGYHPCCCRNHERYRRGKRSLRILATVHRAHHPSGHIVSAVHVTGRCRGHSVVMVSWNLALARSAARILVGGPGRAAQRCIEQRHSEQTDECNDFSTQSAVSVSAHSVRSPNAILYYYIARRHSWQAFSSAPLFPL